MKRLSTLWQAAAAVLALCFLASSANAGVVGSKHDFSAFAWSKNQICLPCHTTHNTIVRDASNKVLAGPLWNHTLSKNQTYTLYLDHSTGESVTGAVDTNSMLCLSCHDGTVALDSFGGMTGNQTMTNAKALVGSGGDLSNDHPIGEAAVWPPQHGKWVTKEARAAAGVMPLRPLGDGREAVGCTSCHEPHNRKNTEKMLWINNSVPAVPVGGTTAVGSPLCLSCHQK